MTLWLSGALLVMALTALLLWPLLRRSSAAAVEAPALAVYRDQLAELTREEARGLITAEAAHNARREIERRLLAADAEQVRPLSDQRPRTMLVLLLLLLLGGGALYLQLGRPDLPARPLSERSSENEARQTLENRVVELEQRLAAAPGDLAGWQELAFLLLVLERPAEAVAAYRQALSLGANDAETYLGLAESLVLSADGLVTLEARQALAEALSRDPANLRALYYAGLSLEQEGRGAEGLQLWVEIAKAAPPDLPWRPFLLSEIERLARGLGQDPSKLGL